MLEIGSINENLRQALATFHRARPSGCVVEAPGVSLTAAGTPYALFNTALVTGPVPGEGGRFKDIIDCAEEFFAKRNLPWSMWFCDDLLSAEERRAAKIMLATRNMKQWLDTPGMIANVLPSAQRDLPKLNCRQVYDGWTRRDFTSVMVSAFNMDPNAGAEVYGGEAYWRGPQLAWVGYVGDTAVATAIVVPSGDALGLYAVATQREHQRKGYAEALMRHAVSHARNQTGLERVVLQSSDTGYPLYVRMGFRNITRFTVFVK